MLRLLRFTIFSYAKTYSALIEFVAYECLKKGLKGISLAPCDSSIKFYETLGFQKTEYGDMTMSEEGIKKFIVSDRAKRAQIITQRKELQRSSAPLLEVLKETRAP
ncbi:MAG: hypothetical protein HZB76_04540 [Chlamydiae bacterium]|nr:hypothetical protein [Chlamydiota bacterium]